MSPGRLTRRRSPATCQAGTTKQPKRRPQNSWPRVRAYGAPPCRKPKRLIQGTLRIVSCLQAGCKVPAMIISDSGNTLFHSRCKSRFGPQDATRRGECSTEKHFRACVPGVVTTHWYIDDSVIKGRAAKSNKPQATSHNRAKKRPALFADLRILFWMFRMGWTSSHGSAWGPVILPVFKTGARRLRDVVGVFDSHTLPPKSSLAYARKGLRPLP